MKEELKELPFLQYIILELLVNAYPGNLTSEEIRVAIDDDPMQHARIRKELVTLTQERWVSFSPRDGMKYRATPKTLRAFREE